MAVRLARRAAEQPASPIRRLAPFAAEARRSGRHVFQLNIGQPDIPAPREVLERLQTFDQPNVAYGPSEGLPEFIEAVREYYDSLGLTYRTEELFATTGGSEALLFTLAAIADHGDDVLVFEPFYTNYSGFAAMVGVRTRPITTYAEDGYHLPDVGTIERQIGPKTRAILLCSPNNPTGTVYGDEELEAVGDVCRRHQLYLVADEVYREFTYDGAKHRSAATLEGLDRQIVLTDSLSKRVSLCGARVGWIASKNAEFMDAVLRFGQARLCPPTLGQHVGAVFNRIGGDYMASVVTEYERRRNLVFEALDAMPGVLVRRPQGAFYMCAKLPVDDAQKFAEFLLRDFEVDNETVMLAPADGFYATPGAGVDEARIAYVLNTDELARAMNVIRAALEAYPGTTRSG
ncbi:MAG: aminotransferase class I/II-fold pyridoxal phosphate-dependent enzyme [Acidobacteria bacterium]|nr:aminotransferase class I/II-fold pyridoxal phosphate-dependent enzyme [Acidobacteriota bacterium]NIM62122.1 aminotransferase class I/II-fold pyridoxal phosphate-dependent enzyme [Acidobacteriota bacterium]NIO59776.1 aminotransferase class I/II-fold pyridoxal phosphate-dependent enzyme [Acidobacteriota bacterium]NIQ30859.1 aminotransferase class I/II-fold pyridoxal phosphate-dependent enzyme [Acidobacteriota bacterium]NIQ85932.1 aminotransferase class I/II-fold pyridoxal phosphate-dependent e